eukprot:GHVT01045823.1.p1 GENE.GHVT01045823.1~~GHVT01045823.1.p1  ORF type:complete len:276 (-),score=49.18 GHVT01045823.1:1665-2492(-)
MLKLLEDSPQHLFQGSPVKELTTRRLQHSGRNCTGRITVRHRGGGHRQRLRFVDFKRARKDIFATVLRIEYDPCRTARLALLQYDDGVLSYILAAAAVRPGDRLLASENANIQPGNCLPFSRIPLGSIVHNVELRPGAGGAFARAAGAHATVVSKDNSFATLRLQSTEVRRFPLDCWATIGQLSNLGHGSRILGKAGVSRHLGRRPEVRGTCKNPVKHPHGGGSSKKHTKRNPVSLWGINIKMATRDRKKPLGMVVRRRLRGVDMKKIGLIKSRK